MNYCHDRCMSVESKKLNTETGLMNYQHARSMSGGKKMLTETGFTNYWYDKCMSSESKTFEMETGLMNYRHDRCMSGESKMFEIETD